MAAGALHAATGFGFSLIASPVLVGAYGPAVGITTLTLISVAINVMTLATEGRRPAGDWPRVTVLILAVLPGAALGAALLKFADQQVIELMIAVGVLAAIAARLLPSRRALPLAAVPAGVLSGAFGVSTGIGGPPLILHLLHVGMAPLRMRDTLAAVFLFTALLGLASFVAIGVWALPEGLLLLVVATAVGHVMGRRVFARMGPKAYERVVLGTMAVSAAATLVLLST